MSKHAMEPWRAGRSANENDGWIISSEPVDLNEPCREVSPRVRGKANADRIVACVNGCAGINPEAVPGLLETLQDAAWSLSSVAYEMESPANHPRSSPDFWRGRANLCAAAIALAKRGAS